MNEICAEISMALYYIEIDFGQRSLRVPIRHGMRKSCRPFAGTPATDNAQ
jgi:hypothetical protein